MMEERYALLKRYKFSDSNSGTVNSAIQLILYWDMIITNYFYAMALLMRFRFTTALFPQLRSKLIFNKSPDFSPYLSANVPQGTTQVITTLSWQGTGNINVTITTPSQTYTESMMSEYQKTTYSTTGGGPMSMLNIKRLSISVTALPSAQSWNITLTYDNTVSAYQISVEKLSSTQ